MTWSITVAGHSNNTDGNVREAEVVKEAFARIVRELRDADLLVTSGKVITNHGEMTVSEVQ